MNIIYVFFGIETNDRSKFCSIIGVLGCRRRLFCLWWFIGMGLCLTYVEYKICYDYKHKDMCVNKGISCEWIETNSLNQSICRELSASNPYCNSLTQELCEEERDCKWDYSSGACYHPNEGSDDKEEEKEEESSDGKFFKHLLILIGIISVLIFSVVGMILFVYCHTRKNSENVQNELNVVEPQMDIFEIEMEV
jgi:hypothetical protein